jgi:hypothetical protein
MPAWCAHRLPKVLRVALLLAAAGVAGAQSDFNVTMRVVDDVRGLDVALIVIGEDAVETPVEAPAEAATQEGREAAAQ